MKHLSQLSNTELEQLARSRNNPYYLTLRKIMKYQVSYFVLVEVEAPSTYNAEIALSDQMPTHAQLEKVGKIKSRQWTVNEVENETSNRPTE